MRFRTVFARLFLSSIIVTLVFSLLITALFYNTVKKFYLRELENHLRIVAISLYDQFKGPLEDKRYESLELLAKKYGQRLGIRITVIDSRGKVLGDSEEDPEKMENHYNRPEIMQAIRYGSGVALRFSETLGRNLMYFALRLGNKKDFVGILRLSVFTSDINEVMVILRKNIILSVLPSLLIAWCLAWYFSRTLAFPIREVIKVVDEIARGNFKARLMLPDKFGELEKLAANINKMAEDIEVLVNNLKDEQEKLEALIENISSGLLVTDEEGNVSYTNTAFEKIFGVNGSMLRDKPYWTVLHHSRVISCIQRVKENTRDETISCEVLLSGRVYVCNVSRTRGKIVILLHDVTKLRQAEKSEKELIGNISHKLRTPLTAIIGYVDLLSNLELRPEQRKYVDIIYKHAVFMSKTLDSLLKLNRSGIDIKLSQKAIDIRLFMNRIQELFLPRITQKNIYFSINIDASLNTIIADEFKLEEIFINLIDNAIKYTDNGGITINISKNPGKGVDICVSDTGIGISEKHLDRLFERFYVADENGMKRYGAGLGLAIVRDIVELFNGSIRVESRRGKGTSFFVYLPLDTESG